MNKLLKFFGSQIILKVSMLTFGIVYIVLIVIKFQRLGLGFQNSDFYKNHFLHYLENGHYNSVSGSGVKTIG